MYKRQQQYEVLFGPLDATEPTSITIDATSDARYVGLLLEGSGSQVVIEPAASEWDLVFTQYTHVFDLDGEATPYLVTGVLLNGAGVLSAIDTTNAFEDASRNQLPTLLPAANTIGYDWKWFDFDAGGFLMRNDRHYLLQTIEQRLYKLRFIDFYTNTGVKGAPTFEFQEL